MPFSPEWENVFSNGSNCARYPWSDLVGLVMKYVNPEVNKANFRVLEVGCGVGANIPFFLEQGFEYHAVEGAPSAVAQLRERYGDQIDVKQQDFSQRLPYDDSYFDLVVDRCATTHNRLDEVADVVSEIRRCLKDRCLLMIVDWFATDNYGLVSGEEIEPNTIASCDHGYLSGLGVCHFFSVSELRALFEKWEFLHLVKKTRMPYRLDMFEADQGSLEAAWDFVVRNERSAV